MSDNKFADFGITAKRSMFVPEYMKRNVPDEYLCLAEVGAVSQFKKEGLHQGDLLLIDTRLPYVPGGMNLIQQIHTPDNIKLSKKLPKGYHCVGRVFCRLSFEEGLQ